MRIRLLPVPVRSGPTSGATWLSDVKEWYIQVRRWGIGMKIDLFLKTKFFF